MSNQILVFNINNELYGIDILKVQEILNFIQPTPIPNCPDYLKGIINLRGTIILVIDLRARFHFDSPMDPNNCVIVVVAIENFNSIKIISEEYLFSHSAYYKEEMGENLKKRFLVFKDLIERDYISEVKKITDKIEKKYLYSNGNRKINIDPAILTLENFILTTNKNFTHRIYLKDGVFADLTLIYNKKLGYTELPWTYADYSSEETKLFLNSVRDLFYNELIKTSPFA